MRVVNRLLAALLSLALIGAGVLVIVEVIADRVNHRPAIVKWHGAYDWAARTPWQQGSVRVVCIIAAAVGLILLVVELKRPRVKRLTVAGDGDRDTINAAYTRRGVSAALETAVTEVDGVRSARVKVKRRTVRIRAATSARDMESARQLLEPARVAAQTRLEALQLARTPKLRVATAAKGR